MAKYPVISLWQPWAQFILHGWKTIETRTHENLSSLNGKDILIHACGAWDKNWIELASMYMKESYFAQALDFVPLKPQIVCMAHVYNFRKLDHGDSGDALIDCKNTHRWGLILTDITGFNNVYIKGHQGIWYVDESILQTE